MKERFLYVEALIDESQNNYNSKQKKLDYSIAMNDEKEFFNNRVHVRKAKLRLIRTEGALGCLIKYTEEDQDIVGKSIIDSRYSESEIEYYKNSPKRYKEYSINSIQKMLDDTTLRLEMCEDNPTCSKRRRDRLRSMIGSMKKEQTVSLESPGPGCILGGQPIIYLNFP